MRTEPTYADVVFKHLGFDVEPIPTDAEERADWKVTVGPSVFLVEEKIKLDDAEMLVRRRVALDGGQVFPTHVPIKPDNTLSGITRKAATQIAATAPHVPHDFRIVWFTAAGRLHEPKRMQYVATLYGSTNIFQLGQPGLKRCYFFRNSDFFRHRDTLDGAVVAELDGKDISARLCLNPLSPRYKTLKASPLSASFGTAIIDPLKEEADGEAFLVDCDLDRAKSNEVLQFLQSKYSVDKIMDMDMGFASAEVSVKADG
ncbi:MAG: hypothetical protein HY525_11245 [Betaproteobacteria bacterium]|nr:hypothetical protein [Betaproteobacteria bacterium]